MGDSVPIGLGTRQLERIYREHARRVRWVARARGVPEHALDDVVHDAFLAIYRRLDERDQKVSMSAWVTGVARNVAFSHRRAAARRSQRVSGLPELPPPNTPYEELERKEAWQALHRFLENLDAEQREAFVLCEIMQTPAPEVAAAAKVKLNTVYSRVRIARRRFEQHFSGNERDSQLLLEKALGYEQEPTARRGEALSALVAELGLNAPGAGVAVLGTTAWKSALVASAVGVASLVAIRVATEEPETPPAKVTTPDVQPDAAIALASGAPAPRPPTAPVPTDSRASTPKPPPVSAGPTSPVEAAEPTAAEPKPRRAAVVSPVPQSDIDPLTAEVGLLARAKKHLAQHRPVQALAVIDEHAAAFPAGALIRQRYAIERDAACEAGHVERATRAAKALGDSTPLAGCDVAKNQPSVETDSRTRGAE